MSVEVLMMNLTHSSVVAADVQKQTNVHCSTGENYF